MQATIIPLETQTDLTNDFALTVSLDGKTFRLLVSWSERSNSWYLDVYAVDQNGVQQSVLNGARLSPWWPVLASIPGDARPPGEIVLWDTIDQGDDPTHGNLGTRYLLAYYPASELGRDG
jgi:hypothetical protein